MKKKIVYVVGTRPEIIRSAFIIKKLKTDPEVNFKLLHTGQHYSYLLDKVFFDELQVPPPDINLEVGSSNHIQQISEIMDKAGQFFQEFNPDMVCVFGDTNSSLATAITAAKLNIPLSHIEAGFREWEMDLPEEINRRLIDHCSNLLIALSSTQVKNLKSEKVLGTIYNTGDPQYDVFKFYYNKAKKLNILKNLSIEKKQFILFTLHRDKNVDDLKKLISLLKTLNETINVIFPTHPRTLKQLKKISFHFQNKFPNISFIEPLSYLPLLNILDKAELVITDSGGLQKEAFWTETPCITLRKNTGWIETVNLGVNFLIDPDGKQKKQKIQKILKKRQKLSEKFQGLKNPYYKKNITENIVKLIKQYSGKKW